MQFPFQHFVGFLILIRPFSIPLYRSPSCVCRCASRVAMPALVGLRGRTCSTCLHAICHHLMRCMLGGGSVDATGCVRLARNVLFMHIPSSSRLSFLATFTDTFHTRFSSYLVRFPLRTWPICLPHKNLGGPLAHTSNSGTCSVYPAKWGAGEDGPLRPTGAMQGQHRAESRFFPVSMLRFGCSGRAFAC